MAGYQRKIIKRQISEVLCLLKRPNIKIIMSSLIGNTYPKFLLFFLCEEIGGSLDVYLHAKSKDPPYLLKEMQTSFIRFYIYGFSMINSNLNLHI